MLMDMQEPTPPTDRSGEATARADTWRRPGFEVIALDCEITGYAPDGGDPLF
jgi:hypothetical protein